MVVGGDLVGLERLALMPTMYDTFDLSELAGRGLVYVPLFRNCDDDEWERSVTQTVGAWPGRNKANGWRSL